MNSTISASIWKTFLAILVAEVIWFFLNIVIAALSKELRYSDELTGFAVTIIIGIFTSIMVIKAKSREVLQFSILLLILFLPSVRASDAFTHDPREEYELVICPFIDLVNYFVYFNFKMNSLPAFGVWFMRLPMIIMLLFFSVEAYIFYWFLKRVDHVT